MYNIHMCRCKVLCFDKGKQESNSNRQWMKTKIIIGFRKNEFNIFSRAFKYLNLHKLFLNLFFPSFRRRV